MGSGPEDDDDGSRSTGQALETMVALEGDGSCIAQARDLAADFLTAARREHGVPVAERGMDIARLVVSELVTNALKYAPGPVLVRLRITGGSVSVTVWDSEPVLPVVRGVDAGRIGQHGLEIVQAVAHDLTVRSETVGKRITARIALTDEPIGAAVSAGT
ncbi:ATP-binding protein [Streptomyces sp. NPDC051214]|uniref:ATP-binding protein n=1 Tax=Streptomyces sp. NPDC051214 TaxID=3155282 RepID=UPI0034131465